MDQVMQDYFSKLELGELMEYKEITIFPLFHPLEEGSEYKTLTEALEAQLLSVTEVDQGGSVPELMVNNNGEIPVLLLDGEELFGAKQNRVLNTTILLKEKSQTKIPVSCTEQGRWSYVSEKFEDSGVVMSRNLRAAKARSVNTSLAMGEQFQSNQGEIWEGIEEMHARAGVRSETGAMRNVFDAQKENLDAYLEAFPCLPDQKGMLVMINGKVAGMDLVSRSQAYSILHQKLMKSYVMDGLLEKSAKITRPPMESAKAFLSVILNCKESNYDSIGYGKDYRYEGDTMVGSALLVEKTVIHSAFFEASPKRDDSRMTGYRDRGHFRS